MPNFAPGYFCVPLFFLAIGEVMMETGATYALSQHVPFPVFFMNITIIGFVRCGMGSSAGAAFVEHTFAKFSIDYGPLAAIREIYGLGAIMIIFMAVMILLSNYRSIPGKLIPKWSTIVRHLRK